jgi:hypothetical protein
VPAISGVLLNNGKPVGGATVFVAQTGFDGDDHCQGLKPMSVTNDDGHFNIDPVVTLHLFTSILNPPDVVLQTTTVCFKTAAEPTFGMSIIARTNRTMSFSASCDLATPNSEFRGRVSIPGNPRGICTNREESLRWEYPIVRLRSDPMPSPSTDMLDSLDVAITASLQTHRAKLVRRVRNQKIRMLIALGLSGCVALFALAAYLIGDHAAARSLAMTAYLVFAFTCVTGLAARKRAVDALREADEPR